MSPEVADINTQLIVVEKKSTKEILAIATKWIMLLKAIRFAIQKYGRDLRKSSRILTDRIQFLRNNFCSGGPWVVIEDTIEKIFIQCDRELSQ